MNTPKVGETVKVAHKTNGEGRFQSARPEYDKIKQVMLTGEVKVSSGDVWKVVPSSDGKAKWQTVSGN